MFHVRTNVICSIACSNSSSTSSSSLLIKLKLDDENISNVHLGLELKNLFQIVLKECVRFRRTKGYIAVAGKEKCFLFTNDPA